MINREYLHAEIYLDKFKQWKHEWEPHYLEMSRDFIFRNTFADLERIMTVFKEN